VSTDTIDRARPTAVDPRIQARRDEVDRDRHHRRRFRLAVAAGVVVVAGLVLAFTRSPLLDVDTVGVDATEHVTTDQILEVAGVHPGDHLVDIDPSAVRDRVLALPWVADAHVGVGWRSGTVNVSVTERVPVAAVSDASGGWDLVDASGRSIAVAPAGDPTLIAIEGVAPVEPGSDLGPGSRAPLDIVTALAPGLRSRVIAVVVAADGSIRLRVRPQGVVDLCQPDRIAEKLRKLTTVFAQVDDTGLATISVCVPESPTLTRSPTP
jgi:cell division protein FtsQ